MATPIPSNNCEMTLGEAAQAAGGRLIGADPALRFTGVSTDTRQIRPGAVFVALRGQKLDGHQYLAAAAKAGAVAAIVERGNAAALPAIEVEDTLEAIGRLAACHVRRISAGRSIPTIAIGGAVGKTTTKELTAAIARALFGSTLATSGNLNNRIGVPLTLLGLDHSHRAMVIECGTNAPGEIRRLGEIVTPDVAMVLNAELEHTERLGGVHGVADEEAALFAAARKARVTCAEDSLLRARLPADGKPAFLFGLGGDADVRLLSRVTTASGEQELRIGFSPRMRAEGTPVSLDFRIGLLGPAAAVNIAAAIAAVAAWAPLSGSQMVLIGQALAAASPVGGRLKQRAIGPFRVLDDTYNASPGSVRVALSAARELADSLGTRLIVALGDMLELGSLAGPLHEGAIGEALAARPAVLIAVGPEMERALVAAAAPADIALYAAADSDGAARLIRGLARSGDLLLVKGSRGMAMERVIEALEESAARA